jgi:hypothetical protein
MDEGDSNLIHSCHAQREQENPLVQKKKKKTKKGKPTSSYQRRGGQERLDHSHSHSVTCTRKQPSSEEEGRDHSLAHAQQTQREAQSHSLTRKETKRPREQKFRRGKEEKIHLQLSHAQETKHRRRENTQLPRRSAKEGRNRDPISH